MPTMGEIWPYLYPKNPIVVDRGKLEEEDEREREPKPEREIERDRQSGTGRGSRERDPSKRGRADRKSAKGQMSEVT